MSHNDEQEERKKTTWTNGIRRKKLKYPDSTWDCRAVPVDKRCLNWRLLEGFSLMRLNDHGVYGERD